MVLRELVKNDGLAVTAYHGDGTVLLAFDIDEDKTQNLAGFAVKVVTPNNGPYPSNEYWLKNRLSFKRELSRGTALTPDMWEDSNEAPSRHFIGAFPGAGPGKYVYTVYACYFKGDGSVDLGSSVQAEVDLSYHAFPNLELGFTRGIFHPRLMLIGLKMLISGRRSSPLILIPALTRRSMNSRVLMPGK